MPIQPVSADALRWACPNGWLDFESTDELQPATGVVGQEAAVDALRFGLMIDAHGQNVFVRGRQGTGRLTLVRHLLQDCAPESPEGFDHVYVHNFAQPDQPRLVSLPPGTGPALKARAEELVRFVLEDFNDLLNTEAVRVRTHEMEAASAASTVAVSSSFEASLAQAGLALVGIKSGEGTTSALVPLVEGEPLSFEDLAQRVDPEIVTALRARARELEAELERVSAKVVRIRKRSERAIREFHVQAARRVIQDAVVDIPRDIPQAAAWIRELVDDVVRHHDQEDPLFAERYRVHVLVTRPPGGPRPVVLENAPTVQSLLGGVDPPVDRLAVAPHLGLHAGALLRADGGTLVLQARDVMTEPGAWAALKRTLRTGLLELSPPELAATTLRQQHVKPDAIPIAVKVVLVGEPDVWAMLTQGDPDFDSLFKVLVDLDDVVRRDEESVKLYGQVLARLVRDEGLPPFTAAAVGAMVEHGARIAALAGRLTSRFGRIADIAREAAFDARHRRVDAVDRQDVERAIQDGKRRADLPGRRFRDRMTSGTLRVKTEGAEVGQVNGLAVIQAGPLTYGFPLRVTATVGAGTQGTIHVEREAMLSGQIHTKGFFILQGLLRYLLRVVEHPLVFDASITHEQSYGGVDGDSASGAEFVCLMSALIGVAAEQGRAMTGAIDQHGNILPVGGVDEKIEGFFDACTVAGLTGSQGVLVPASNVADLQLRRDVVAAVRAGRFSVYAIDRIEEALELLLGQPAEALIEAAVARAGVLWNNTKDPQ